MGNILAIRLSTKSWELQSTEKKKLTLLTCERRSTILFWIGTSLLILGVLVPFLLVLFYFQFDPEGQIEALIALGVQPANALEASKRDWHLLVAGASFGILFIAAARGIFSSESRHREIYNRQEKVIDVYSRMIQGLEISARLDNELGDDTATHSIEAMVLISKNMLEASSNLAADWGATGKPIEEASELEIGLVKQLVTMIKR